MLIGVPLEVRTAQTRVAATPTTTVQLVKLGYDVLVESGAGMRSDFHDQAYLDAGATLGSAEQAWGADIVFSCDAPTPEQVQMLRPGAVLVSMLDPAGHPDLVQALSERGVTAMSLDAVPRISRAQALDVLSSMANIAGYRAVIEAANEFGGVFNGQVTAAGKMPPAKVFVAGAGVAGLAAIGAAGSMGAQVRAFDVRPEVAEQIESMGAEFVQVAAVDSEVSSDGYAKEMSKDQAALAAQMYAEQSAWADIVITTAQIRGKAAPRLLTEEMVAAMRPGSVIVDMAASTGGNAAPTRVDERVVTENGVTVLGWSDLAGRLPRQASQLFGTNLVNLMKLLTPNKDGQPVLDFSDEVVRSMTVSHQGQVMWPPPPVKVSAAPVAKAPEAPVETVDPAKALELKQRRTIFGTALGLVLFGLLGAVMPAALLTHWMVLMLAIVCGFYVISNVSHALHTPLMAETNAISGIIMVGAILQVGSSSTAVTVLAMIAVLIACINVAGGFIVTRKMLTMFRRG